MKKNNYMPKTPKEKGLFVGAIICIVIFIPCLIFIMEGIGIIPFLIIALLAIGGGMTLALYAKKIIDARLKEEGGLEEQPKVEEPDKAKEPEPVKAEVIPEPAPAPEVVEPEPVVEEPVFEEEPTPVQPVEKKKPNKAVFAVIIPIVAVALVAAVAIPVAIHFANNNNEIRDDGEGDGGGKNTSKNNGGKVSFNITATTRYEETREDGRTDCFQFEPNKDYIQYRFILSDAGWYVEWIDYGKWSFDATTGYVSAVCTNYDTYNVNGQMTNKTYSEGAANAQKSFKVINDTTLYWNGNSNFVIKKVSNFTHPIVIFQERP
jgi:flagellar basal body-associated protein FliL